MTRTMAADLCPDWFWTGHDYRHRQCGATITFPKPSSWKYPRPDHAHCGACGTHWRRHNARWEKEQP